MVYQLKHITFGKCLQQTHLTIGVKTGAMRSAKSCYSVLQFPSFTYSALNFLSLDHYCSPDVYITLFWYIITLVLHGTVSIIRFTPSCVSYTPFRGFISILFQQYSTAIDFSLCVLKCGEPRYFRNRSLNRIPEAWKRPARMIGCSLALATHLALLLGALMVILQQLFLSRRHFCCSLQAS